MNRRQYSGSTGSPIQLRRSLPPSQAGLHTYRQPTSQTITSDGENPDAWTIAKPRTSAVRYVDTQGNTVIQQGRKRLVIHEEPPPRQRRRPHWLIISGLSIIVVVLLWAGLSWLASWWTQHTLDTMYEFPRVSQTNAVVYPGDTPDHPSHYLFLNLNGTVLIIELPHGDSAKARIYKGPTIFSDNADQVPITGEFRTVENKIEMLVHIQDRTILYINNGTQFIPQ